MFRYLVLFNLLKFLLADIVPHNSKDSFTGRIVNGTVTTIQNHPYQVSLQSSDSGHFCGGSFIAKDIVLTAAHCVVGRNVANLRVRLGSTFASKGGKLIKIKTVKYHEHFTYANLQYDVAVLKLETAVNQSSTVRYIELVTKSLDTDTPAIVTGWGLTCSDGCGMSDTLMQVEVSYINRTECASEKYLYGSKRILESMICAYAESKDSCGGDSGGPLVADGKLIGIVSWGYKCAEKNYPGVYSDVFALHEWILKATKEL